MDDFIAIHLLHFVSDVEAWGLDWQQSFGCASDDRHLGNVMIGGTAVIVTVRVLLRKNVGVLGEHRLTITYEGLLESTIHNESLNRWSSYERTVSTKNYLMLYVTETAAHLISKQRPLLEGDLVAFESLVREKTRKP